MKIKLEKLCSNLDFIELETGCEINDIWAIIFYGFVFNPSMITGYIGSNCEEYISLLYKHGADCYYKNDKRDNKSNLYFSDYEAAKKALEAVEALEIMNKLTK